jgi:hypothetical protein
MAKKKTAVHKNVTAANAVISFLVLLLAFATLILFKHNHDAILATGNFNTFIVMATLGFALLLTLLYLVNKK